MKKVLVFTISNGEAYNAAGRAIINALANRYPSVTFKMVDVSKGNKGINFQLSEEQTLSQRLAHRLERHRYILCKSLENIEKAKKVAEVYLKGIREYIKYIINTFEPTVIITTHAFPAIVLSELRLAGAKLVENVKLGYVECNYVVSPYIRLATNLDYYFSPTEDAEKMYRKHLIKNPKQIVSLGIPIVSQIENITEKSEARELLGIEKDKYTILITNGENQSDHTMGLVKAIINRYNNINLVVMCHKNVKLRQKMTKYVKSKNIKNVKVIGHSNNMGILLSACDVVMGKTVGVEVAEVFAKGIPFISTLKAQGQELDNLKYLKKKSSILNARSVGSALSVLDQVMKNSKTQKSLLLNSQKLYKHNATDEIIKFLYHAKKSNL